MTTNEELALVGVVLAAAGLAYVIYEHNHASTVSIPPVRTLAMAAPSGGGIGNAIAQAGGAAVAQLGKSAAGWASSEISSLFNG